MEQAIYSGIGFPMGLAFLLDFSSQWDVLWTIIWVIILLILFAVLYTGIALDNNKIKIILIFLLSSIMSTISFILLATFSR